MNTSTRPPALAPGESEQLKLLAIFHFILAGLTLATGVMAIWQLMAIHQTFAHFSKAFPAQSGASPPAPDFFPPIPVWPSIAVGTLIMIVSLALALSGFFLLKRRHRMFILIVAGLNCLSVPLGTVLGVFTIVVLGRDNVRTAFASSDPTHV
jgi:hypothetical protein